jgi:hypothetical protein
MMLTLLFRSVLLLALLTSSSWAQQTADSTVSTAEEATAETASEAATDVTEPEPEPEPEPEQERVISPPDEYRASEQISDDSSVSFPVDI